uniref:Transposase n=1 Tax=Ditylenchus dipsaci TaxID=166011 RepID=A0A915CVA1_9BILA
MPRSKIFSSVEFPNVVSLRLKEIFLYSSKQSLKFFVGCNLINNEAFCNNCEKPMLIELRADISDNIQWRCIQKQKLCSRKTIRKGSFFERSHLRLQQWLIIFYMWANDYSNKQISKETGLSTQHTCDWLNLCREICQNYCHNQPKLGGPGSYIEIDESSICKRRYSRGRYRRGSSQSVFGGADVELQSTLPATYWKVFEHVLEKNDSIASKTCNFFHQSLSSGGFDKSLRAPHRLLLWSTEHNVTANAGQAVKIRCEVSNGNKSSSSAIRNLLGRGWLALIVFNNSIAIIQKQDYILMDYPLVWVTDGLVRNGQKPSGNSSEFKDASTETGKGAEPEVFSARIIAPEYEFHIEFPSFQMKRDFLESVFLMKKHKLARDYNSLESLGSEQIRLSPNRHGEHKFSTAHPTYKGPLTLALGKLDCLMGAEL